MVLCCFHSMSTVAGGILLFFIVEKIVRRVEELSSKTPGLGHAHHHHSQKKQVSEGSEGTHVADGAGVEDKEIKPLESNRNLRKVTTYFYDFTRFKQIYLVVS